MLAEIEGQVCGRIKAMSENFLIFELGGTGESCICCEEKVTIND
jgi:hypothetical protein